MLAPRIPTGTYRVQFNRDFTFARAQQLVDYLHLLGVSDLYASPYLQARPGSPHGYDITDHNALNAEIGSDAEHAALAEALRARGMGQLLDIVPNHMGIVGGANAWWLDVLENGRSSPYAGYFDIDWEPATPELRNKVLLPVLGDQYGRVLENQELALRFEQGAFFITYYDNRWPVAPRSYGQILEFRLETLEAELGADSPAMQEYRSILTAVRHLPPSERTEPEPVAERQREKEVIKRRLAALCEAEPRVRRFVEENVRILNGVKGDPRSFDRLEALLDAQNYRLSHWRVAAEEINYRRFFDINDLAALRVERPEVFQATHRLILRLVAEGKVTGLRVDHPDGLYDPEGYFATLQRACAEALGLHPDPAEPRAVYLVAEKILARGEALPASWPVHGTTGYEALNAINGLFVDSRSARALQELYSRFTGLRQSFEELVYEKKKLIMRVSLSSEVNVLGTMASRICQRRREARDFTRSSLTEAIAEIIASFPVYRTYVRAEAGPEGVSAQDRAYIEVAVARAKRRNPATSAVIFDFLRDLLLLRFPDRLPEAEREAQVAFVMRFQQTTGPVMAKGLEDTAFYVYNRLVSLNEVGGDPGRFGLPPAAFHDFCRERQARWPHALTTLATHDTKRGEDTRARINVLSELPREWRARLARWATLNQRHKREVDGQPAPDRNEEYLFYQTLLGAWPFEPEGRPMDRAAHEAFCERIERYMQKATKEAKVNTSWVNPNQAWDEAVRHFVRAVLDPAPDNPFLEDFRPFQRRVAEFGIWNSLAQTLLKLAMPGVPDTYQGTELWDLSLVDPDNRRPVDYAHRERLLARLLARARELRGEPGALARELVERRHDGAIKLYLVHRALVFRRERPALFGAAGGYLPLEATGLRREHVCAFARRVEESGEAAVVAVPRLVVRLLGGEPRPPLGVAVWEDTAVAAPPGDRPGQRYRNVLTGEGVEVRRGEGGRPVLPLAALLSSFPVALLERESG
ncbi:MAG TPA: malto-oligosyltrehalose synthase [Thermodesulfobacteriota bacterium]|nr:malto-oligosyltrehalose synthase [Thermodesulfobacteriota bacterium]